MSKVLVGFQYGFGFAIAAVVVQLLAKVCHLNILLLFQLPGA